MPQLTLKIVNDRLEFVLPEGRNIKRPQDAEDAYLRNGHFYFSRYNTLMGMNSRMGKYSLPYIIQRDISINLDSIDDWKAAEKHIERFKISQQ